MEMEYPLVEVEVARWHVTSFNDFRSRVVPQLGRLYTIFPNIANAFHLFYQSESGAVSTECEPGVDRSGFVSIFVPCSLRRQAKKALRKLYPVLG